VYPCVSLRIVANRYVSVRIGAYRCVWIRIGGYQCVPVRIVTYRCESVRIGLYRCLSLCIVVYRCTPVRYRCCVSVRMDSYRWVSVRMGYSRCVTYSHIEGIGVSLRTRTYRCPYPTVYGIVAAYRCVWTRISGYRCVSRSVSVFRSLWRRCVTVSIGAYQCVCIGAYPTVVYPHTIGCMDLYWAYRRIGRIGCIVAYEGALSGVSGVSVRRFIGRIGCIGAYESVSVCIGCVGAYESVWVTCKPRGAWMRILRTRYPASNGCVDVYRASDGTPPFFWNKKIPNFLGCIVYAFSGGHVLTTITHTAVYAHCSNNPCSVTTQQ
jgi:hypothetical protein